jgi:FkbM family methyltransferase
MLVDKIITNPWLYTRKGVGRLKRRLISIPKGTMERNINGCVRFEYKPLSFLDDDDFRAMLTGSYDIVLCDILRIFLGPGDIAIDVGANVGYISAVAASLVGPSGEVHGFEPLKECYERLRVLQTLNPQYKFVFNNVALGQKQGSLSISYEPRGGSRNASLVEESAGSTKLQVPVVRLDDYIFRHILQPERIKFIKIDVEGFEFPVLLGAREFFAQTPCRPPIICEIKPWVLQKCGFTLEDFEHYMTSFGYKSYDSVQRNKSVGLRTLTEMEVLLFRA